MRKLNQNFVQAFNISGIYHPIIRKVIQDNSLDFEIRNGYINIYFKGNSILKLYENNSYEIHPNFVKNTEFSGTSKSLNVENFIKNIPIIKDNVIDTKTKHSSLEIEYEQLLIASNNFNKNVNSEIFITDRQFADSKNNTRFDLSGFYWSRNGRKLNQTVPLTFIEVKYSLNNDISDIDTQIERYYNVVKSNIKDIAEETEYLKNLKIELGLINQSVKKQNALKTLKISNDINKVKFIIALIDYNPYSKLLDVEKLKKLTFSNQIEIYNCGLAIWDKNLKKL